MKNNADIKDAIVNISIAYQMVKNEYAKQIFPHYSMSIHISDILLLFPYEKESMVYNVFSNILGSIKATSETISIMELGSNRKLIKEIEERRYTVSISEGRKILNIYSHAKTENTLENCNFLIRHVTELAYKLP